MIENIQHRSVFSLKDSVTCHSHQVRSRSLCSVPGADITLLAFGEGEGISAEEYSGDTLYMVLDGGCTVADIPLRAGESAVVPAGELHSVESSGQFRLLQITAGKGEKNMKLIDHIPHKEAILLKDQIDYEAGQVVSMTLTNQPQIGMTLFAFDEGTKIGTHAAPGDAMPTILEGEAEITISGETYTVSAGESIVMPAGEPHSLRALTRFKMLLVLVKQ